MFFPDGGDLDFINVVKSSEEGCMDIISNFGLFRVKPSKLVFEKFDVPAWNYFLLKLSDQDVVVEDSYDEYTEEVVEDAAAHYVSAKDFTYGVYDYDSGMPLPKDSKKLTRYLKGKFLFVLKLGPYNYIQEVTDGRHNNCSTEDFRGYITSLQKLYNLYGRMPKDLWEQARTTLVQNCPFKPQRQLPIVSAPSPSYEEDFAKKNYMNFDFSDEIHRLGISEGSPFAEFRFRLENIESCSFMDLLNPNSEFFYLRADGKVAKMKLSDSSIFALESCQEPVDFLNALTAKLKQYVQEKVNPFELPYFKAEIQLKSKPSHLFTKAEIEAEMRAADDRKDNVLVISIDGSAQVIPNTQNTSLYPVVHETWCAGNNYVGRYSRLSDLDSAYHYCLAKWYDYLTKKCGQPMEDYDDCSLSVKELVENIEKI